MHTTQGAELVMIRIGTSGGLLGLLDVLNLAF